MTDKECDVAISVRNLSRRFDLYSSPADLAWEVLTRKPRHQEFWALRDVNFDLHRGEVVGIVGRNGAGKSTLLKILAGTLAKTEGDVRVHGRISPILELGTGFHPEYTGRQNILMGGLCLGMSRQEVNAKLEWIVAFSELREFIDRPLKTYSTGMHARLAFGVAVSIDPDILIVDEALSVGDAKFQRKCFAHLEQLRVADVTILLVSHDARTISHLCDRVILLEKGQVVFDGPPRDGIKEYHRMLFQEDVEKAAAARAKAEDPGADASMATSSAEEVRYGTRDLEIVDVRVVAEEGLPANSVRCGEPCAIAMRVRANHDIEQVSYGFRLTTVEGTDIYGTSTGLMGETAPSMVAGEELEVRFAITTNLAPGHYFLTVGAARDHMLMYDRRTDVLVLDVLGPFRGYESSLVDLRARVSVETVAPVLQRAEA